MSLKRKYSSDFSETDSDSETQSAEIPQLPLTQQNLHLFDQSTSSTQSEGSTMSKMSQPVWKVRHDLRRNLFFVKDEAAVEKYQEFFKEIGKIVKGERLSAMKDEQCNEVLRILNKFETDNETTLLVNLWKHLLQETRIPIQPKEKGSQSNDPISTETLDIQEEVAAAIEWIEKAWEKDHLKCTWQALFPREMMPKAPSSEDPFLDILFKDLPRVASPVPDLTYGLQEKAFTTEVELQIILANSQIITDNLYFPFFIVEAKSASKPIGEAENQACRGGAAIVNHLRNFLAAVPPKKASSTQSGPASEFPTTVAPTSSKVAASTPSFLGPDKDSFCYSLCLTPWYAEIFVNWTEQVSAKEVHWHMHLVANYDLAEKQKIKELRHDIDNILDWGVLKRRKEITDACAKIVASGSKKNKKRKTESREEDDEE